MSDVPHEVLEAVWRFGGMERLDRACLALACPEVRPWATADVEEHRATVRRMEADVFCLSRHYADNPVRVSRWLEAERPPPVLPRGCAANVYVDRADAGALAEICEWLGLAAPRQLFFYTYGERGPKRTLTDAMLLACAVDAEALGIVANDLITDAAVSRLRKCKDLRIGQKGVTFRSLRELPDLRHVQCSPSCVDPDTKGWLADRRDSGLLFLNMW
jgi:hypothetical protein